MRVDVGSETSPILVVLHTHGMTEDSAHVLSKANIGGPEVDLGIAVIVSTNVIRITQNAFGRRFSAEASDAGFSRPLTFRGYHHRILDIRDRTFDGIRSPCVVFGTSDR